MAQAQQFRALNGQRQSLKLPSNSSHRPTPRSKTKGKMPPVTRRRGLYSVTTSSTLSWSHLIAPELKFPIHTAFAARKAGHGNDRAWKAWKAMKPASHPSHTLWKSLRDSHIPTASTTGYMSFRAH